jgi:hypothetical protein
MPFREGVNVLLGGTKEIQKVHAHVFACLANAQEHQILPNSLLSGNSRDDMSEEHERLDRMLGVVVIPGHAIVIKKSEEGILILLQPRLAFRGCVTLNVEAK